MSQDQSSYQNDKRQELKDDAGKFGDSAQQGQPSPQANYGQPQYGQPQYGQANYGQIQYRQPQYGQAPYGQPAPQGTYAQPGQEPLTSSQQPQLEAQTEAPTSHADAKYGQTPFQQDTPAPQYGQQPAPQYRQPDQFTQQQQYSSPFQQGMPGQPGQPGQFGQFGQQAPFGQSGFQGQYAPQDIYAPVQQRMLGFVEAFQICLYKIFNYEGRASRSEFWFLSLWEFIIATVLCAIIAPLYSSNSTHTIGAILLVVSVIFCCIAFFVNLSCTCRRLHDTGKSGWLQLLYLVPCIGSLLIFIFCVMPSEPRPNQYGDIPNRLGDAPELDRIKARRISTQTQNQYIYQNQHNQNR